MYVETLHLTNFRNYEEQTIAFCPYTNMITGDNAQGKTNLLEAVYLFSQGKSHRTKADKELIGFGKDFASLSLTFHDKSRDHQAVMKFSKSGRKAVKMNGVSLTKLSMLLSYLNAVIFSPEDLNLVKGSPGARRKFLDSAISQLYPNYLGTLIDYFKVLGQKNSLLKTLKRGRNHSDATLSVWNEQLASLCVTIMTYRKKFLERLSDFASQIHDEISGETLEISYTPSVNCGIIDDRSLLLQLEEQQEREIEFGSALLGIHRDDVRFFINGKDVRMYGSQGQQRTVVLSLKMAQTEYIYSEKDEYPILLLDDIMSELDQSRRRYLSRRIRDKQVLITCTDTDVLESDSHTKLFYVQNGHIKEG
jgi:DNA replication and repair protein RecF